MGRDPDGDVHVSSQINVSNCHIRIGFDKWGQVVLKDISRFGCYLLYTKIRAKEEKGKKPHLGTRVRSDGDKANPPTCVVPVGWQVSVGMGPTSDTLVWCVFQVPDHSSGIEQYRKQVKAFTSTQTHPINLLGGLALDNERSTTRGLFTEAKQTARDGRTGRYAWIPSGKLLGQGAFGEVIEVFNTSNWCVCAGKRMREDVSFQQESKLMKRLNHRYIVQYIDVEERTPESNAMIIMEYFPLGDLKKQQRKERFQAIDIVRIIGQIASALAYLHSQKVTHRDLKPENILLAARNPIEIAVTDFGVSQTEETEMMTYAGTHKYMAPEVVGIRTGQSSKYTNLADIWSLGVVAVTLLNGGRPESGEGDDSGQNYAKFINRSRGDLLCGCAIASFRSLVWEMLEMDPKSRPTAEQCLARASAIAPNPPISGSRSRESRKREGKDPAEGVRDGSPTARPFKRVGLDSRAPNTPKKPSAAGPSTQRTGRPGALPGQKPAANEQGRQAAVEPEYSAQLGTSTFQRLLAAPPTESTARGKTPRSGQPLGPIAGAEPAAESTQRSAPRGPSEVETKTVGTKTWERAMAG